MKYIVFGLLSGLLFGIGLTISTMVDPQRVLGFLDIFGNWDPTLAFVMGGGLVVFLPFYLFYIRPYKKTIFNETLELPTESSVDKKLIIGAMVFGLGWGLSGICPGPAITNLSGLQFEIVVFVVAMMGGLFIGSSLEKRL